MSPSQDEPDLVDESPDSSPAEFPCETCGATATWDPEHDALACAYCGQVTAVPRGEGMVVERALDDAGSAARGLGLELRVGRCQNCGASVGFDQRSTSEQCVYCGSSNVLAQEANRNAIRPESLVPLDVARSEVEKEFRAWLKGLWFRPNALKQTKRYEARGVYVPFWTFDCRVRSDWSADSGTYYWVTQPTVVMVRGKPQVRMRQVRKVNWRPAWGERDDSYDDMLVPGSVGLPETLIQRLGDFDTQSLVPYRPEYLAGWGAEEYGVDLEQGWERGLAVVRERQEARCAGDVPGDVHRNLRVKNHVRDVFWKHVLLPVWSLQYRFRGKVYTVLVNGQTGRVVGEAPWSWVKIAGLVVAIGLAALLIVAIAGLLS